MSAKKKTRLEYLHSAMTRFWSYVDKSGQGECWLWTGTKTLPTHCGLVYGTFGFSDDNRQVTYRAHRFSYVLANGEIPDGLQICHSCDTPLCVNPAHLWAGTNAENCADRNKKDRVQHGERHWSAKLKEDDVRAIRSSADSVQELSKKYGVHATQIAGIQNGTKWQRLS